MIIYVFIQCKAVSLKHRLMQTFTTVLQNVMLSSDHNVKLLADSLCSRRLEVVEEKENVRKKETLDSRVPVLSFAHYFQAPAA